MYDQNNLTGGLQYVPQIAVQQVIYLDFDGESTSYDGEILSIDGVEVAPSQLTAERIAGITAKLNERYALQGISFVTERPLSSAYSTIFVGQTAAFDRYGSFAGLAETIDKGNLNSSDKAFVLIDAADTDETIIATISHETDHLTGTLDHGGEGLAAYAAEIGIENDTSSAGLVVGSDTSVYVNPGELLENVTVNSGGSMTIYSGGTALMVKENGGYVTVKDGAHVQFAAHILNKAFIPTSATLHEGTVASDATVVSSGFLHIFSGGSANNTAVNGGGSMTLERGGIATSVTVRNGGTLQVSSGGGATAISAVSGAILQFTVASNTFIQGAYANSSFEIKNGFVTSYTIQKQGVLKIVSGGAAVTVTVGGDNAIMRVSSGGRADSTTVTNGNLIVSSAGVAQNTTVNNGGFMTIFAGASAILIKENGGFVEIESGASVTFASNTFSGLTLSTGATLHAGTIASSTVLVSSNEISGYLHICSGGQAIDTTVNKSADLYIFSGGMANNVTNNSGGIDISSGGVANSVTLAGGDAEVSSGGTINMTTVNQYGELEIYGGVANSTTVGFGGSMLLASGGVANGTTVADGGRLNIDEYCIASSNTVEAGGIMVIVYNATADVINVASGGTVSIWPNATAVNLIAASGARLHLGIADMTRISGEYAGSALQTVNSQGACYFSDYTIDHGGSVEFFKAGIGSNITVNNGRLEVSSGGQAFDTIVNSGGAMNANAYAMANNVTVNSGGKLYIGPKATLTGTLDLGGQMTVNSDTAIYADINLRLDQRTAGASTLINDFSAFKNSNFTITIADEQEEGTYRLADYGAGNFADLTITISSTSAVLGTLTVGGDALDRGEYSYQLTVDSKNALYFTVTAKSVPAPEVTADVTTLTNTDVVLTVTFSPKSTANEYRINGGDWQSCSTTTVTATQNALYEFRSQNANGSYSAVTAYTVNNIDKTAPVITVTPDTTEPATEVTLTATVDDGSALQYSYDGIGWSDYTAPILLIRSGTVYFRAADEAGNITTETVVIDNVRQLAPLVTADTTALTNGNVTLTVFFRPEGVTKEYSTDNVTWQSCSETLEVTANGTFYFRDTDADGGVSQVTTFTVSNIDKTAPDAPEAMELIIAENALALDWTDAADKGVAGLEGYYFRYGSSANLTGEGEFVDVSAVDLPDLADGQWYFQVRSVDNAGNSSDWSQVFSAEVDRVAPVISVNTCDDRPVYGTFLQVTTDDGSPLYYSNDGGETYTEYTGIISVFENSTWYFKATDKGGNTTVKTVTLNNIDSTLPNVPSVTANVTAPTTGNVVLSADFTGFVVTKQWSLDGVKWRTYTKPQTVHNNVTLYFREIDIFGNVSDVITYTVSNIDKTAPDAPGWMEFTAAGSSVTVDWDDAADNGTAGIAGYNFRYGSSETLTGEGEFVDTSIIDVAGLETGTWYFQVQSVDGAGNVSAWSEVYSFTVALPGPTDLQGDADGLSWAPVDGALGYEVEYSTDGFATAVTLVTATCAIDSYALPEGTFQWRVRTINGSDWVYGGEIVLTAREDAEVLTSDADGDLDLFFGNAQGVWAARYAAQHLGSGDWKGTQKTVLLEGKNKIADIFAGSDDANTLVLTDDANGDALFVDDIYSALGDQARFSRISKILAGAGDDIVDMTSQRYAYSGSAIKIQGGDGNDILWGGAESNILYGDAGNDDLAGASGNDILAGGDGNDTMHGGGGNDIFCFGGAFGNDTVEQLETGSVTLWFENGSEENWNAEAGVYTDGTNSVTVTGCTDVTLQFGTSADLPAEVFDSETSKKVFEDKGMLA